MDIATWMPHRYFKLSKSQTELIPLLPSWNSVFCLNNQWVSLSKYLQKNLSLGNRPLTHYSPAWFPPSVVPCCNPSIMVVMDILSVFSSGLKKSWGLYISVPHKWLRFDWECLQLNTPNIKLRISLFISCFSSCR